MKQTFLIFALVLTSKLSFAQFQARFDDYQPTQTTKATEEYRITAYYKNAYTNNSKWESISLKVQVITNSFGRDELKVVAYKSSYIDSWVNCSSSVSDTYGDIKDTYRYRAYVSINEVFFNL